MDKMPTEIITKRSRHLTYVGKGNLWKNRGAFRKRKEADLLAVRLRKKNEKVIVVEHRPIIGDKYWRVYTAIIR